MWCMGYSKTSFSLAIVQIKINKKGINTETYKHEDTDSKTKK